MENKQTSQSQNPLKWIPTAYFAMGLPFIVLSMVSVLMFQDLGVSKASITFWLSIITLPWTLKPLWSPFLELFKTKKFFVVLTQLVTGITFALVAFSLHLPEFFQIAIALMGVIAISGATHDIALDGIYLSVLSPKVQAQYIGWQGAFYNMAKLLSFGGLVYVAGVLKNSLGALEAWTIIMGIFSAIMVCAALYHIKVLPTGGQSQDQVRSVKETYHELIEIIISFFKKKHIIWYIIFIVLYRSAEGLAMKVLPLFLADDVVNGGLGLRTEQIGIINGICGALAFVIGSILGGYYISRFSLKKTLFSLCCIFNIPFVIYLLFAIYQPSSLPAIGLGVTFEWFGYGFGFVGLTLFMMQQVAPGKHKMAHYAFASGIMNLGVLVPGAISGLIAESVGYKNFFIIVLVAAIPAFIVTALVPFTYDNGDPVKE
ncbi:putative transmembrane protein [Bacteroides coprosuis DSM 18011]|uniref:Putative transmembrane protein n=1 Tax=Bacteroides coprosuis DSM 18011 TaxID=679937 RepID=F3ZQE1_9BACE|nr:MULTISPECIES: MFS transporter [Bacteroides]EGJ70519.1 putative transmembrane protein [Bacteroides coprosuis DSM 18011]HJD92649.1 MFS transporter [Bacteroides coprosuis]